MITKAWLDAWEYVIPFLAFPDDVRPVIYTTNAIEALNRQLRKAIKTKGHSPTRMPPASDLPRRPRRRTPVDPVPELNHSAAGVHNSIR